MTQKVIDFGKSSVQYLLTMLFAAIGVYVGLKVNETEQRMINQFQDREMLEIRNIQKEIKQDVTILWNTTLSLQIDNAVICKELGIERTRSGKSNGKE